MITYIIFIPPVVMCNTHNYGLQIKKCNDLIILAEQVGDEQLAESMRGLIKSFREWEKDEFWD